MEIPLHVKRTDAIPIKGVPRILLDSVRDVAMGAIPFRDLVPSTLGAASVRIEDQDARVEVTFHVWRKNPALPNDAPGIVAVLVVLVGAGDQVGTRRIGAGEIQFKQRGNVRIE